MDDNHRTHEAVKDLPVALPRTVNASQDEAIRRLSLSDLAGARRVIESLVEEILQLSDDRRKASYLMFDLLCEVDRTVAEHQGLPQSGLSERLALAGRLLAARTEDDQILAFWTEYHRLIGPVDSAVPPGHPAVEQVKSYIRANYTHKISLSEISTVVGVSRNYLSHLFKRHCGVTVTEFIHRIRMRQAEKLLLSGGRTVSEIAYLVGYQNYRDFHRNFVKFEKISPKKFRQYKGLRSAQRLAATT